MNEFHSFHSGLASVLLTGYFTKSGPNSGSYRLSRDQSTASSVAASPGRTYTRYRQRYFPPNIEDADSLSKLNLTFQDRNHSFQSQEDFHAPHDLS